MCRAVITTTNVPALITCVAVRFTGPVGSMFSIISNAILAGAQSTTSVCSYGISYFISKVNLMCPGISALVNGLLTAVVYNGRKLNSLGKY